MKKLCLTTLAASVLAACGGGGNGGGAGTATTSLTLSGTAAVGAPIVGGSINTKCAAGPAVLPVTTGTDGSWTMTATGQTLPCAVQASGGTINGVANPNAYESIATSAGTVNVTPVTDLVMANLTATDFNGLNGTALSAIAAANVTTAINNVRAALGLTTLNAINPLTGAFTPTSGNLMDDTLSALKTAMTDAGVTQADLVAAAHTALGSAFTAPSGLAAAWTQAYTATTSGTSGFTLSSANGFGGVIGIGNELYILGANLGVTGDPVTVTFAGGATANTTQTTANTITVVIPIGAQSGKITVKNTRTNASATSDFDIVLPVLASRCISYSNTETPLPVTGAAATSFSDCTKQAPDGQKVVWLNNSYVAVGGGVTKSSSDGYLWTDTGTVVDRIAFNGVRWVGIKTNTSTIRLISSTDTTPTAWNTTNFTLSNPGELTDIHVANGRFFVSTNNGNFLTSTDGLSWTETARGLCGGASSSPLYAGNAANILWTGLKYQFRMQGTSFAPVSMCTSTDGITWATEAAGVPPSDVYAWNGTKYVASTATGIQTSVDRNTWIKSPIAAPVLSQILWTGTQFIGLENVTAGASNTKIHTSTDGLHWVEKTLPLPNGIQLVNASLAYSPTLKRTVVTGQFAISGMYVTPASKALFVLHDEPSAAVVATLPAPDGVSALASGNSITVSWNAVSGAAGYDVYRATTPGLSVNAMTKIASGGTATSLTDSGLTGSTTYYYKVLAVVDAATVTTASAEVSAATPMTWTNHIGLVSSVHFLGVTWTGDRFVAIGGGGRIYTSPTGAVWTFRSSGTTTALNGVAGTSSLIVAVDSAGGIRTSADGAAWTLQSSGTANYLSSAASSGSLFVVVGDKGLILTSPDGVTWTPRTSGTTSYLAGVAWAGNQFVATGAGGTILTSPNGVDWTARTSGTTVQLSSVARSSDLYVAVGGSGTVLTSPDGVSWTARTSGTTSTLNSVSWSGSQFVAVGIGATLITSGKGVTWSAGAPGSTQDLNGVTWSGNQFLVVGRNNTIVTSP
ncbi:fibronectin type III domain-containing protein [Fluviicoccus keumensis]|nr:fibronectin type III domain-containing protein [Fluviicoccus keumensis]